MGRMWSIK